MPEPSVIIPGRPMFRGGPSPEIRRRVARRRGIRRAVVGVVVLVVLGWAAAAALKLLSARRDLEAGKHQLDIAKTMTSNSQLAKGSASTPLRLGATRLDSAHADLVSVWVSPLRYVPVIGRQLESARALSNAGAQTALIVANALDSLHAAALTPPAVDGRVALIELFSSVMSAAQQQISLLDLGPTNGLISPLASARNDLQSEVSRIGEFVDRASAVGRAGADLLAGQHRVLVLLTNNAEMRNGSGMANQLGLLQVKDGHLSMVSVQSVYDVPVAPGLVPAAGDFGARWGWLDPTSDWQELLSSPDFDVTAPLAQQMWNLSGQPPVDAVIAVDPFALQAILLAVGPVHYDGQTVTSANVLSQMFFQQYVGLTTAAQNTAHDDAVGELAKAATASLEAGNWSPSQLFLALADAARGRHIMVWSNSASDESAWQAAGAGGALQPDSLMVSLLNRSRSKSDQFVSTSTAITLQPAGSYTQVSLAVSIANRTPAGLDQFIAGPGAGVQPELLPGQTVSYGDYVGVLAVTLPEAAVDVQLSGVDNPAVYGPQGPNFAVGAQYIVRDDTTTTVLITFEVPTVDGRLELEPSARAPAETWTYAGQTIDGQFSHLITW